MTSVHAFIFDLDGVLTDTAEYHYQSWQRLTDEMGIPFSRQRNEALRGLSRRRSLEIVLDGRVFAEEDMLAMMDRKNRYFYELIETLTSCNLLPGVPALLDELRTSGIKVAIGSGSRNAREVIRRLGIGDQIDAIADAYAVVRPKPAPDLFIFAAGLLNVPVSRCVGVEDAEAGVEAAKVAGMYAVGLGPAERVGAAGVVFPDLSGVSLGDILRGLGVTAPGHRSTPTGDP